MIGKQSNLPFEAYLDLRAEHATGLKAILVSPLLYHHIELEGRPDTDTLRVGRAGHAAVLEPTRFLTTFARWDARRAGKEWEAFKALHEGRGCTVLTATQYENAVAMADAVRADRLAARLLDDPAGEAEVSITWRHAGTGLLCKARLDFLGRALVELKTARDPSPGLFSAAAARMHYAMQLACYAAAVESLKIELPPVKVIAVQNVPPFDVVVYDVPDETMDVGVDELERALMMVAHCRRTNEWPGVARGEEQVLRLPAWASPDYDEDSPGWGVTTTEVA